MSETNPTNSIAPRKSGLGQVTARFYVEELTRRAYNPEHAAVKFKPAYRGVENKAWSEATPSGEITLQISNPAAVDFFAEALAASHDLHLTFEVVEKAAQTT